MIDVDIQKERNLDKIKDELENVYNVIILTHHNADVDGIASAIVLKKILEKIDKVVDIGVAESISEVARKFVGDEEIKIDPDIKEYENIIVVDTSAPEQLIPIKIPNGKNLIVIDHHIPGPLTSSSKSYVDPDAKSCSEIIFQISRRMGVELTPRMGFLLASGIIYDTAHLRNADIETFETLVELLKISDKSYSEILDILKTETDISERIATLKAFNRSTSYRIGDIIISFTHVGSFEAAVARNLLKAGADIAIVAAPKKKSLRISGRMKSYLREKINLAEIFSKIEEIIDGSAGGHDVAASANGKKPGEANRAFREILKMIEKSLGKKSKRI
ncbi:MAG: DHH family phosphoesterase [Candidatus Aenigmarchaeota archaeon]|nr:DHH family phosphoesterase [Candidatus Aenigmarchaeota archaeon]